MNKKIMLSILLFGMILFSLASVSAVAKSYDEETKVVTIKDTFLFIPIGDIAEVQLKTPLFNKVGISPTEKIRVAEFEIRGKKDWNDLFHEEIKTYNKKKFDKGEEIELEKEFEYRIKSIEYFSVNDYNCSEQILGNGSINNNCVIVGNHQEQREVWNSFDKNTKIKKDETYTIGLYTTTQKGDYIEWIPTFLGKEIDEWASWSASLNTSIISYYDFEETSGNLADKVGGYNLTASGTPIYSVSGIVNNAVNFTNLNAYFSKSSCANWDFGTTADFTINYWMGGGTPTHSDVANFVTDGTQPMYRMNSGASSVTYEIASGGSSDRVVFEGNISIYDGNPHMVTMKRTNNGAKHYLYIDGVLAGNEANNEGSTGYIQDASCTTIIFGDSRSDRKINTWMDEFGVWGRGLSISEILELYSNGLGCTYQDCILLTSTITLNSPTNDTIQKTTDAILFNSTISDNAPDNVSLILDGTLNETNSSGILGDYFFTKILSEGEHTWTIESCLDGSCVNKSRTITIDTTPFIEFLTPATLVNYTNITQEYIPMQVNISTPYFENISYSLRNVNGTNYTQEYSNTTYSINFTNMPDAHYHYDVTTCTTTNKCNSTETRNILIDTIDPTISTTSPVTDYGTLVSNQNLTLTTNITDTNLDTVYYDYGSFGLGTINVNESFNTSMNSIFYNYTDIGSGFSWTNTLSIPTSCEVGGVSNITKYRYSTFPSNTINYYCTNSSGTYYLGNHVAYSGVTGEYTLIYTGRSILSAVSGDPITDYFTYEIGTNNLTVYVNDTAGNMISLIKSWDYRFNENSKTYQESVVEGSITNLKANISIRDGYEITFANLIYNGTSTLASVSVVDGYTILSYDKTLPQVTSNINVTFIWEVVFTDDVRTNLSTQTQEITNIAIDDCSNYTHVLLNFTLLDEDSQSNFTLVNGENTTMEVNLELKSLDETVTLLEFNKKYSDTNPALVCINSVLDEEEYLLDITMKYEGGSHSIEYYNLQNFAVSNATLPKVVTLYDLNLSRATEFQVTYRNDAGIPVEDVLISVSREYVSEFIVVEQPLTDSVGQTVVHLVQNDIRYEFVVSKDGVILAVLTNKIAFCEDATIGKCDVNLKEDTGALTFYDYDDQFQISYTATYNQTSDDIKFTFATKDSTVKNVTLIITQFDMLGSSPVSTQSLTSTAGTITYSVPETLGNATFIMDVYVDGTIMEEFTLSTKENIPLGKYGYVLFFFMFVSMIFMFSSSKSGLVIGAILGFVSAGLFTLQGTKGTSVLVSVIWLIIAGGILLWKLNEKRGSN